MQKDGTISRTVAGLFACVAISTSVVASPLDDGVKRFQKNDYLKALNSFDRMVDSDPTDGNSHYWRANCLVKLDRMKDALAEYKLAYLLTSDAKVKSYCREILAKYKQLPALDSVEKVRSNSRAAATPEGKDSQSKPFKLKTEKLEWNLKLSDGFRRSLAADHARLDSLAAPPKPPRNWLVPGSAARREMLSGPGHNYSGLSETERKLLSGFDVVVVLDRSGSMSTADCPGDDAVGRAIPVSRWDWVKRELDIFAGVTSASLPQGFTVMTFNDNYSRHAGVRSGSLSAIYGSSPPAGGTTLAPPLRAAIGDRPRGKRLAIVVITDGCPGDGSSAAQAVIEGTRLYPEDALRVIFLQVGADAEDERFIDAMDNLLVAEGARYDACKGFLFSELRKLGLAHALCQGIWRPFALDR